jgi:acylphosphatase
MPPMNIASAPHSHGGADVSGWSVARRVFPSRHESMIAKRVTFEGRVQGVGFRYTVKDLSRGFDVCGWVKNLPDGNVELHVMGEPDEVDSFIREIVEESPVARNIKNHYIDNVPPLTGCTGFRIEK